MAYRWFPIKIFLRPYGKNLSRFETMAISTSTFRTLTYNEKNIIKIFVFAQCEQLLDPGKMFGWK